METYDVIIAGGGPVALTMARALQHREFTVCLCGLLPPNAPASPDLRTAALFNASVRLLTRLGAWDEIEPHAAALKAIRIVDNTKRLLRAPEITFSATDIGAPQLGFNVPNPAIVDGLVRVLNAPSASTSEILTDRLVVRAVPAAECVTVELDNGDVKRGKIAIAADGRRSLLRAAANIDVHSWDWEQAAITAHFTHAIDNHATSTEIQFPTGPCTVVPLAPHRSGLVWMDTKAAVAKLAELPENEFIQALEANLQGLLGPISELTSRRVFPLSTLIAKSFAADRIALIGEAAHAFPPIGAQGLNLGLRDVALLLDALVEARSNGRDLGAPETLANYHQDRTSDVWLRTVGVDLFNRSLRDAGTGLLRGAALHAGKALPRLRSLMIEGGTGPVGRWPSLMRPKG